MAKPTGIPKAAPPADPNPEKTADAANPVKEDETETAGDPTPPVEQDQNNDPTPPTDPTPPADPNPETKGEVVTTGYLRATKDTMYDAYSKNYFFTNRATRVDLPLNNWLVCQIEAGLLEKCAKDYGPKPMAGESDDE